MSSCHITSGDKETCFTKSALERIRKVLNTEYPNDSIPSNLNKSELIREIRDRMQNHCKHGNGREKDACIVKTTISKRAGLDVNKILPPKAIDKINTKRELWTTYNIEQAMKRFEKEYPDFKFIGPTPIDFDLRDNVGKCLVNELCNISLSHL